MIRNEATNTFQDGLVMDLNPLTTPNTVLTSALNATFVTFNGNEYVLQNDMGNGRVETAKLPEGYIPIGTTELGGIIYIVSYNPLIDQCQIGSFPSPERIYSGNEKDPVISKFEDGNPTVELKSENFVKDDGNDKNREIINTRVLLQISSTTFNPGDQYIVTAYPLSRDKSENYKHITDCFDFNDSEGPRDLRLQLITLDSNNKVIELSPIQQFEPAGEGVPGSYFLLEGEVTKIEDVEGLVTNYRNIVSSAYNTFKSKVAGVMYIEADLEVLTSMNVTHKCINVDNKKYTIEFTIDTEGTSFQNIEKELKYIKVLVSKNQINTSGEPEESKIVERQRPSIDVSDLDNNSKVLYFSQGNTNTITLDIDFSNSQQLSEIKFSFTPAVDFGYQTSLTRDVVIDFTKVNTGALNITYWKYLKRDNDIFVQWMIEYYPLEGRYIKQFDIEAKRLDQDTPADNWELLETYSSVDAVAGNYTRAWNNLILDSIYLIQFHFQESTGEQDDTGKDIYRNINLYKCLYTNGIFDNLFEDNEIIDFDQEYINLDYKLNYNYSTNRSSKSYTYNQEATRLPGDEENENPFGYTAVLQDDVYQLTPAVTLENTYNTFSVDNENTQISITDKNIYLKNFYRDLRGEGGDAWFINPDNKDNFSNIENGECIYDKQSLSNKYKFSFIDDNPDNPIINFSTLLFNKIRADGWNNTPTDIAIKNLWVPIQEIVPSKERQIDYNNGDEIIKTEAYPYTQVIAVGINSGNSGGGPHYFLGSKNLIRDDTNNRLGISTGEAEIDENSLSPRTMDTLLYNLSNIPAGDLINKLFTVLLYIPSGDGTIRIQGVEKGEGNENHYYYFNSEGASGQTFFWWSNSDDHYNLYIPHSGGLDSSNDRDNFEKSNTIPYGIIQLLLPVSNGSATGLQSQVIAINAFIPIKNYQYEMGTDRDTSQFKHTPYLWNLLSSFYRDVYWKTYGSRQGYKIQSYTYENNIKVDFSIKLTGNITDTGSNIGSNIQFNNIPFSKLQENYKNITDITDEKFWLPCLKINKITSEDKEFQLNISRSQNISNELITVFNASVRDIYVEPYLNNERILMPDTLTGNQAVVEYTKKEGATVLSLFNKSVRATSWSNISNPYIEGYKIGDNGETQWVTQEIQLFNNDFDLDSLSLTEDKIQVATVPPDNYLLRFRSPGGGEWGYSVSYKAYNIFNNFNII